jgi:hypothetical protein
MGRIVIMPESLGALTLTANRVYKMRAWFKLLGTKVTLCFAELPVSFAANGCGSSGCAKKDAPLCLTKCYPAVNQAKMSIELPRIR